MYHKHLTEGIVIRGMDRGDSSKVVTLLTKEFGLVYASVQNARAETSKLRYGIQDFTSGTFSLVKGRHSWKLVGTEARGNFWINSEEGQNGSSKFTKARVLSLARRLSGEEKNQEFYEALESLLNFKEKDQEKLKEKELETILKMLKTSGFLKEDELEIETLVKDRRRAIEIINNSLNMAGLE